MISASTSVTTSLSRMSRSGIRTVLQVSLFFSEDMSVAHNLSMTPATTTETDKTVRTVLSIMFVESSTNCTLTVSKGFRCSKRETHNNVRTSVRPVSWSFAVLAHFRLIGRGQKRFLFRLLGNKVSSHSFLGVVVDKVKTLHRPRTSRSSCLAFFFHSIHDNIIW